MAACASKHANYLLDHCERLDLKRAKIETILTALSVSNASPEQSTLHMMVHTRRRCRYCTFHKWCSRRPLFGRRSLWGKKYCSRDLWAKEFSFELPTKTRALLKAASGGTCSYESGAVTPHTLHFPTGLPYLNFAHEPSGGPRTVGRISLAPSARRRSTAGFRARVLG